MMTASFASISFYVSAATNYSVTAFKPPVSGIRQPINIAQVRLSITVVLFSCEASYYGADAVADAVIHGY